MDRFRDQFQTFSPIPIINPLKRALERAMSEFDS